MEQAAKYSQFCSSCGQSVAGWWGQEFLDHANEIRWFIEWECPSCGVVSDESGIGVGPATLRRALLDEFGGAIIAVSTSRPARLAVVKRLREMFGLSLAEALAVLAESGPNKPIGTAVEVRSVIETLEKLGYHTQVMQTEPGEGSRDR